MQMKHHYIVKTLMRHEYWYEWVCRVGTICPEEELSDFLKLQGVTKYKIMSVDDDPVPDWDQSAWIPVQ